MYYPSDKQADGLHATVLSRKSLKSLLGKLSLAWPLNLAAMCDLLSRVQITNSRNSALSRGFQKQFLLETSHLDGRTKNWTTKLLLHGPLWHRNSPTGEPIQDGRPTEHIT